MRLGFGGSKIIKLDENRITYFWVLYVHLIQYWNQLICIRFTVSFLFQFGRWQVSEFGRNLSSFGGKAGHLRCCNDCWDGPCLGPPHLRDLWDEVCPWRRACRESLWRLCFWFTCWDLGQKVVASVFHEADPVLHGLVFFITVLLLFVT